MKLLVFVPPKDFRDESLAAVRLLFGKWNVTYSVTSYSNKECTGYHGAVCRPDVHANRISISDYDGVLLLDGKGMDEFKLYEYRPLLDMLLQFNNRGKYVGAVGNSVKVLARANIINGKKVATPQDEETRRLVLLFHGVPSVDRTEVSGNIISIRDSTDLELPLRDLLSRLGVM